MEASKSSITGGEKAREGVRRRGSKQSSITGGVGTADEVFRVLHVHRDWNAIRCRQEPGRAGSVDPFFFL